MKAIFCLALFVGIVFAVNASNVKRRAPGIADAAANHVGSTEWSKAGCKHGMCGEWKCNLFVADMIEDSGRDYPKRRWWKYSPIGANEWANPGSSYILDTGCWRTTSSPGRGDVAAYGGHVGIVSSYMHGQTISAAEYTVVQNDWGFRSGQNPTFWEYIC